MYSLVFLISISVISFLSSTFSTSLASFKASAISCFLCSTSASIWTFLSSISSTSLVRASMSAFSSFISSSISRDLFSMSDICISLISISFSFKCVEFCRKILPLFCLDLQFFFTMTDLLVDLCDCSIALISCRYLCEIVRR